MTAIGLDLHKRFRLTFARYLLGVLTPKATFLPRAVGVLLIVAASAGSPRACHVVRG